MSRSSRDQRHRPRSTKRCPESAAGGCAYCTTGEYKPAARRHTRRATRQALRTERNTA